MIKKIIKKILYRFFSPILNEIDSASMVFEKNISEYIKINNMAMLAVIQADTQAIRAENHAMFLWLIFGTDIKPFVAGKEPDLWVDYTSVFDREREFAFFNSIPIEVYGEFAKCYKSCFVIGNFADLVAGHITNGHFLIPSTRANVDIKLECGHRAPIASIPYLMENNELFISCNPNLTNVLLGSHAILSAICDKTSELCILPVSFTIPKVEVTWGGLVMWREPLLVQLKNFGDGPSVLRVRTHV